jgi:hypothetical protein
MRSGICVFAATPATASGPSPNDAAVFRAKSHSLPTSVLRHVFQGALRAPVPIRRECQGCFGDRSESTSRCGTVAAHQLPRAAQCRVSGVHRLGQVLNGVLQCSRRVLLVTLRSEHARENEPGEPGLA